MRSLGNEVVLDFGEYTPRESEFYWLVNHTATGLGVIILEVIKLQLDTKE